MAHSERLQKIPKALLENRGSLSAAMRAVGYGPGYAKNPQTLRATKAWKETMEPLIKRMEKARDAALDRLNSGIIDEADVTAAANVLDKVQKNLQLITGKPTENVNHFANLSDAELAAIVASRASNGSGEGTSPPGASP